MLCINVNTFILDLSGRHNCRGVSKATINEARFIDVELTDAVVGVIMVI